MTWLELSLTLRSDQQESVEAALEDVGALAVTLLDAEADTSNEQAILEPAVGETPLWSTIVLAALFEAGVDRSGLLHVLGELLPELEPAQIQFREVADQDWTRVWMDQFQPMQFGRRLWIYPWNIEPPADEGIVTVRLDPGLAFGTGTHPTTALCLEWLDQLDLQGKTVIDFGCGSGVLAIAAALLGAAHVTGIDNDPQAIEASRDNAGRNGVADRIELALPDQASVESCDLLVANILAGPLYDLAPLFAMRIRPGGLLALSGILDGQQQELLDRYAGWFDELVVTRREDWIRINGRRR
ncbi:50S ribosomal protein L11 methyltransferase [Dokdonella sp.]|uniref:50S ribosomal protein L11 methyltransferase n=1 Tax=Dokdonella sp. TaxID=2291710 RepID=UPI002CC762CF|nr:50S ribosomal protein L11 methyltransferase [Dokdonella sp.]HOX71741.1 50S ribosomal protein L11 methyltransferase [Dokdonella sp.]HPN80826.1 50S ribosomal protein L11 methyltransferase [Dokdonella sp.]